MQFYAANDMLCKYLFRYCSRNFKHELKLDNVICMSALNDLYPFLKKSLKSNDIIKRKN